MVVKKPTTKLWPNSYQQYFEIGKVMDLYTHYVQSYTNKPLYTRFTLSNYRSHKDWNHFFKAHAFMKELECPPEVYLEGVFSKYKASPGRAFPLPSTLKYFSFLVMEYLRTARISQGNFYQIPDGVEDSMAKQVGRGVINYIRLKDLMGSDVKEEQVILNYQGSFEDYFVIANPDTFMKYFEDKDHLKKSFKNRWEEIQCKMEYFKINFQNYEKLVNMKNRIVSHVKAKLALYPKEAYAIKLSDIQRELEEVKYRV